MKRIIKDFKNISEDVVQLINEQYPTGYADSQLVSFVNAKGEFVKALEVRSDDVIYLIKMDRKLDAHINDMQEAGPSFGDDDSDDFSNDSSDDMDSMELDAVDEDDDYND